MVLQRFKKFVRRHFLYSFKSTIMTLYLPIIVIFIFITGWISSMLATSQIEENAYKNINDTVFQTKNYLDYMLSDVFQQLVSLSSDPQIFSLLSVDADAIRPEAYVEMDKSLQAIYSRSPALIDSVMINLNEGSFLLYHSDYYVQPSISYNNYFTAFKGNKEGFYWRNLHPDPFFQKGEVVSVFRLVNPKHYPTRGIVLFNLRADFFEQVLNKSLIGDNGYLTLISPDGKFESKTVKEEYKLRDSTLRALQDLENESGQFSYQAESGENMIVIYDTIKANNWKLAAVMPESEILNKVNYIKHFTTLIIILLTFIAIFLTDLMSKYISRPFKHLARQMDKVDKENLELDYEMSGPEEMQVLHNGFKGLMGRIHTLMDQIQMEQEEKRQLEFAVMHAQINPHFLYNTLYSIKGLCDMGLNKEASQMITALSSFFRIGISKGREIITIEEEIQHIKHYLFIQEMRYGDDFSYVIEVEDDILENNIIKLSLQPLIENAIYHGVKQKRGKGVITIRGYLKGKNILLEVADNGNGIQHDKLEEIAAEMEASFQEKKQFIGIGLKSVNERIKIHFGPEYGLSITSEPGNGTVASIVIPKTKGELRNYA
jgi:two-component system, sensor histidine kinase YesM